MSYYKSCLITSLSQCFYTFFFSVQNKLIQMHFFGVILGMQPLHTEDIFRQNNKIPKCKSKILKNQLLRIKVYLTSLLTKDQDSTWLKHKDQVSAFYIPNFFYHIPLLDFYHVSLFPACISLPFSLCTKPLLTPPLSSVFWWDTTTFSGTCAPISDHKISS